MNVIEATGIVDRLGEVGFDQVAYEPLWTLADHYSSAKSRLLVLTSYNSIDDLHLGFLLFGQTEMPTYIVTDFPNPFASSCFANNVHIVPCDPQGNHHTARIIERFRNNQNFVLVVAVEHASKTHNGYFYLAQGLQIPMIVAGFDYYRRNCIVSAKRWRAPKPHEDIAAFRLQQEGDIFDQLRTICPQKPQQHAFFNVAHYKDNNPDFDMDRIQVLDSRLLQNAVAGNSVSTREILAVLGISVCIIVLCVVLYLFSKTS